MAESADELRRQRKLEHLEAVRALGDVGPGAGFDDVQLLPDCAPEVDWDEVDLSTRLCGVRLAWRPRSDRLPFEASLVAQGGEA